MRAPSRWRGSPLQLSLHPGRKKVGFVLQNSSSSCQVLAAPSASRSSPHPSVCQPGPGAMGTARLGKSPAGTRGPKSGVGRAGAPAAPGASSVGRGGARFGAAN